MNEAGRHRRASPCLAPTVEDALLKHLPETKARPRRVGRGDPPAIPDVLCHLALGLSPVIASVPFTILLEVLLLASYAVPCFVVREEWYEWATM
jgi:hypothetical protein